MDNNITCAIPGASNIDQVISNSAISDISPLSKDQMETVERVYENYIKEHAHLLW
jgi:aryl-alcohol dehydrogenase-like predicted oxidoreductase